MVGILYDLSLNKVRFNEIHYDRKSLLNLRLRLSLWTYSSLGTVLAL
jgi:hypothetical protein